jgi:4-carboxymuconolactone decarboxylase
VARLPYVEAADAAEPVRDALGRVPPLNIFRMMANAETAFRPWLRWGATLLGQLELDPLLRELAILRVARLTPHAEYEWVQHVPLAKAAGASDAQVAALEQDQPDAECFTSDQRTVLHFTTEVLRDVQASDATLEQLGGVLSPREIVELLMVIGQYMMVARVMATTRMEIDEPAGPGALSATG